MPTATDLVTDLPADFEVFGQAVATSMADLLGGTTGQILAKNSNTDMDFVWVANDQGDITAVTAGTGISGGGTSGAVTITNSMATEITAKGDLIVGTGSATFDNLAAGANGSTLVADSSTSTGLRYQGSMAAGKNAIINGAFDIWQRGTSIAVNAAAYTTDRWMGYRGAAGMTISRQSTNDTTNLPFIQYCARVQRDSGNTSTQSLQFTSPVETSNVYRYAGQTVTMSFYARAGANYSPTSSALGVYLSTGTGTDGNPLAGYTGQTNTISQTATLTTTWQRFSYTATLTSTTTQFAPYFLASVTGTAGAADYFEVTGVQVEIGSVATPFTRTGGTIQGELAACQRYYYRATSNSNNNQVYGTGFAASTTTILVPVFFPVQMRTTPTSLGYSNLRGSDETTDLTPSAVVANSRTNANILQLQLTVTGATAFRPYFAIGSGTAGYIEISAEL